MQPTNPSHDLPRTSLVLALALLISASFLTSACVTNRKIYDSQGVLVDEQNFVKPPFWKRD